jgi:hypothetical protein
VVVLSRAQNNLVSFIRLLPIFAAFSCFSCYLPYSLHLLEAIVVVVRGEPVPRSKTRRSRSGLPTSTRMLAEAWPRVAHGLPLPSTVTRSSPSSNLSSPGINVSAYSRRGVPTTGVTVIAFVPPQITAPVGTWTRCSSFRPPH